MNARRSFRRPFVQASASLESLGLRKLLTANVNFPDAANVAGVIGCGPVPSDGIDDTPAIESAIYALVARHGPIKNLPSGTDNVSNTLTWVRAANDAGSRCFISTRGQGSEHAMVKLANDCNGITNVVSPKAVIDASPTTTAALTNNPPPTARPTRKTHKRVASPISAAFFRRQNNDEADYTPH